MKTSGFPGPTRGTDFELAVGWVDLLQLDCPLDRGAARQMSRPEGAGRGVAGWCRKGTAFSDRSRAGDASLGGMKLTLPFFPRRQKQKKDRSLCPAEEWCREKLRKVSFTARGKRHPHGIGRKTPSPSDTSRRLLVLRLPAPSFGGLLFD